MRERGRFERRAEDRVLAVSVSVVLGLIAVAGVALAVRRCAAPRVERKQRRVLRPADIRRVRHTTATGDEQTVEGGSGALMHRAYEVPLAHSSQSPAQIVQLMKSEFVSLAPSGLAEFKRDGCVAGPLSPGDEFEITMLGPWNGRVRVVDVGDAHFTLATLRGHPEAGRITFSAHGATHDIPLRARIVSWARARDRTANLAYRGAGKSVQTEVWITFLQRLSTLTGAVDATEVSIITEDFSGEALMEVNAVTDRNRDG